MDESADSSVPVTVREDGQRAGSPENETRRRLQQAAGAIDPGRSFFVTERDPSGLYRLALTDEGIQTFETALGIADDFGRRRSISTQSTIADLMDRAAIREELAEVRRQDRRDLVGRLRLRALAARYRGSEEPPAGAIALSRLLRAVAVLLVALWTLRQFGIAIADIQAIPGILSQIPSDILHLDPGRAITAVGRKIADAEAHVIGGIVGVVFTYVAAAIFRPFAPIYRKDALAPALRAFFRFSTWILRHVDRRAPR
ncbi:MAG TPA: hypothetical protein VFB58_00690 [Chloroflexota bacterium]|nr:hypothetical protein [Chloroflexota bacterium]